MTRVFATMLAALLAAAPLSRAVAAPLTIEGDVISVMHSIGITLFDSNKTPIVLAPAKDEKSAEEVAKAEAAAKELAAKLAEAGEKAPALPFALTRAGATLVFEMGDYVGKLTSKLFVDIAFITLATDTKEEAAPGTVQLESLLIDGKPAGDVLKLWEAGDQVVALGGLPDSFSLTGIARLAVFAELPTDLPGTVDSPTLPAPGGGLAVTSVPEPASMAVLAAGLAGLAVLRRRRIAAAA